MFFNKRRLFKREPITSCIGQKAHLTKFPDAGTYTYELTQNEDELCHLDVGLIGFRFESIELLIDTHHLLKGIDKEHHTRHGDGNNL